MMMKSHDRAKRGTEKKHRVEAVPFQTGHVHQIQGDAKMPECWPLVRQSRQRWFCVLVEADCQPPASRLHPRGCRKPHLLIWKCECRKCTICLMVSGLDATSFILWIKASTRVLELVPAGRWHLQLLIPACPLCYRQRADCFFSGLEGEQSSHVQTFSCCSRHRCSIRWTRGLSGKDIPRVEFSAVSLEKRSPSLGALPYSQQSLPSTHQYPLEHITQSLEPCLLLLVISREPCAQDVALVPVIL
jgi:hypothetical protein